LIAISSDICDVLSFRAVDGTDLIWKWLNVGGNSQCVRAEKSFYLKISDVKNVNDVKETLSHWTLRQVCSCRKLYDSVYINMTLREFKKT